MSELLGSTLTIDWWSMPDGSWLAKCDSEPGWKYETEPVPLGALYSDDDRAAGQTSLKRYHSRGITFLHWAHFAGRDAA